METEGANEGWPSFIQFVNATTDAHSMKYVVDLDDLTYEGKYIDIALHVRVVDPDPTSASYKDWAQPEYYEYITWRLDFVYFPINAPPSYAAGIPSRTVYVGKQLSFATGPASADTTQVAVTYAPDRLIRFSKINIVSATKEVKFVVVPSAVAHVGTYTVEIKLKDEDPPKALQSTYSFYIIVKQKAEAPVPAANETKKQVVDTSRMPRLIIQSVTASGLVKAKFSRPMQVRPQLFNMTSRQLNDILAVYVVPGQEQKKDKTRIVNYRVLSFTATEI